MSGQQGWQCLGRQQHGWFGNGTCSNGAVGADDGRYQRIVFGVIGHLPATLRSRWDGMLSRGLAGRTADVLRGLSDASGLSPSRFGELLPDTVGSIAAGRIQVAAHAAAAARTQDDERTASVALADAVQAVGLDGWSRFVAQAGAQTTATPTAPPQMPPGGRPSQAPVHLLKKQIRFFDTLGAWLSKLAEELGLPKEYIFGLSA